MLAKPRANTGLQDVTGTVMTTHISIPILTRPPLRLPISEIEVECAQKQVRKMMK